MEAMRTRTVTPVSSGGFAIARVISLIGTVIAAIIVIGILLVVLDANARNAIVEWFTDAARWLAGPFRDLFAIDNREWRVAVNWGLAAIVYLAISRLIARFAARA